MNTKEWFYNRARFIHCFVNHNATIVRIPKQTTDHRTESTDVLTERVCTFQKATLQMAYNHL